MPRIPDIERTVRFLLFKKLYHIVQNFQELKLIELYTTKYLQIEINIKYLLNLKVKIQQIKNGISNSNLEKFKVLLIVLRWIKNFKWMKLKKKQKLRPNLKIVINFFQDWSKDITKKSLKSKWIYKKIKVNFLKKFLILKKEKLKLVKMQDLKDSNQKIEKKECYLKTLNLT